MKKLLLSVPYYILPMVILILWWLSSENGWVHPYLLPSPSRIVKSFILLIQDGSLWVHISASLSRVGIGFSIATLLAFLTTLMFYLCPYSYLFFASTLRFLQQLPPLALFSLLIIWFGIGEQSKIVMIILASFFPILINFFNGIQQCDEKLLDLGRVVHMSQRDIFFKILFPASLPYLILGLKLGLVYGWRSLIGAELIATNKGLGYMILDARELSRSDIVIIGIFCFGIVGTVIDLLFNLCLSFFPFLKERKHELY